MTPPGSSAVRYRRLAPRHQLVGQCIDLETYRLKRVVVGDEFDGSPVITTEGRQRLLAEIRLSASADDHAGREWAKVADFLARQFRSRPIMASDPPS